MLLIHEERNFKYNTSWTFFPLFFRQLWTWIYLNVWKCIDLYWFAWVSSLVLLVSGLAPLLPDHHLSRVTSHALLVFIYLPCYQFIFVFKVTSHALLVYTYLPCYQIIPDINEVEFVLFRVAVWCGDTWKIDTQGWVSPA